MPKNMTPFGSVCNTKQFAITRLLGAWSTRLPPATSQPPMVLLKVKARDTLMGTPVSELHILGCAAFEETGVFL
jgi:hypothetical protein